VKRREPRSGERGRGLFTSLDELEIVWETVT